MKTCFNSEAIITQNFGQDFKIKGKLYYKEILSKKYDIYLIGHNGIDLVPYDKKDLKIFSIFGGKLIKKYYNKSYGYRIVIYNNKKMIIECHNHFKNFDLDLKLNQIIEPKQYLGIMGNTGDSKGAHNHFQIAKVNEKAERVYYNNGYLGYTDPRPYLRGTV